MRLSGVLLLFLVIGHLFVIRILANFNEVDLAFVTARWSGLGWRSYDLAMLVLAMAHGANGVRGLLYDHGPRSWRARLLTFAYALCAAATVLGCYVIVTFSRPLLPPLQVRADGTTAARCRSQPARSPQASASEAAVWPISLSSARMRPRAAA